MSHRTSQRKTQATRLLEDLQDGEAASEIAEELPDIREYNELAAVSIEAGGISLKAVGADERLASYLLVRAKKIFVQQKR